MAQQCATNGATMRHQWRIAQAFEDTAVLPISRPDGDSGASGRLGGVDGGKRFRSSGCSATYRACLKLIRESILGLQATSRFSMAQKCATPRFLVAQKCAMANQKRIIVLDACGILYS
jgi:hypothetical protein